MSTSTVEPDQVNTCVGIKRSLKLSPSVYLVNLLLEFKPEDQPSFGRA
jgi:hypothetical protein